MIGITILIVVLLAATAFGLVYRARSGTLRPTETDTTPETRALLLDAGARTGETTVLHFSAEWCGPCAAVRRVVERVVTDVEGAVDLEVDIDARPELARAMGVMSLPTTFVIDRTLAEVARIPGVPAADALRSAVLSAQVGR